MKTIYKYITIIIASLLIFTACEKDNGEKFDTSGDVNIHSFKINGVEGVVDTINSTVTVILPTGTSLANLAPQIQLAEGAEISPRSGDTRDFADAYGNLIPVTYTVVHNNIYQKYVVSVDVSRAKITSFKILNVDGEIDDINKKINVYLPEGTDLTQLIPVVEYTEGATMTPSGGSVVDFTNPVTYTLEFYGSSFTYEVTAHLGDKPIETLVIYNGENVKLHWDAIASAITNGAINPKTDGINTSSTCISIVRRKEDTDDGGKPWSGGALWNNNRVNIDPAIYGSLTIMVLKEAAGEVQLEIQSDGEENKDWLKVEYSAENLGEWQELTFEIPEGRAIINNILVAPHVKETHNDPNFSTHTIYWDELKAHPRQK